MGPTLKPGSGGNRDTMNDSGGAKGTWMVLRASDRARKAWSEGKKWWEPPQEIFLQLGHQYGWDPET